MVAIFSGNSLGLNLGSLARLGSRGQFGQAAQGSSGERAFVNAATGNLVLQTLDALLVGLGTDAATVRTYNSQGGFDFDNADGWLGAPRRSVTRVNATTLKRTDADGSVCSYVLDPDDLTETRYLAVENFGSAQDVIEEHDGCWLWTDGATGSTETYDQGGEGLIRTATDTRGRGLTFGYQNGLLETVTSTDGEVVTYSYEQIGGKPCLSRMETRRGNGEVLSAVSYHYDGLQRLDRVTVDLDPTQPGGGTYVTEYGYDGNSTRISSIAQNGRTTLSVHYESGSVGNGDHRIEWIEDGLHNRTSFEYEAANGSHPARTLVTDPMDVVTAYEYDGSGRLTAVKSDVTAENPDGLTRLKYGYDAAGNVETITDGVGNQVVMGYDDRGNLLTQVDGAGNTVVRAYDEHNRLLSETVYGTPAKDGEPAGDPRTTRYVYDANSLLRFTITAEGRVTEHRYAGSGLHETTIAYGGGTYLVGGLDPHPTELQLKGWAEAQDLTRTGRTDVAYDFRGQVSEVTTYARVAADGAGVATSASTTTYVYDHRGLLVETLTPDRRLRTSVVYDGLGRAVLNTETVLDQSAASRQTVTLFDDAGGMVTVTQANGLITESVFDAAGRLWTTTQKEGGQPLGTTRYEYDANGRLVMTEGPTGQRRFQLWDDAGRLVGEVDPVGALTEYVYDAAGRVTEVIAYLDAVDPAVLAAAAGAPAGLKLDGLRPAEPARVSRSWSYYDAAGRLEWQVDALGYVTHTEYDGTSNVISVTRLARAIDTDPLGSGQGPAPQLGSYETSTSLTVSNDGSGPNAPRVLTATVTTAAGSAADPVRGLVTFFAGTVCLGAAAVVDGVAQLTVANLPVGENALRAVFAGDVANAASASEAVAEVVFAAPPSTTTLTVTGTPTTSGMLVLRAAVEGQAPSGTVVFYRAGVAIGSATVVAGVAELSVSGLAAGATSYSAAYLGDASNARSGSAAVEQVIARATPTVTLDLAAPPFQEIAQGVPVTLTATVSGSAIPGGTMQFWEGTRLLGEAAVENGVAQLVTSDLTAGRQYLKATYGGDTENAEAASSASGMPFDVGCATTTTLGVSLSSAEVGAPLVLTATVMSTLHPPHGTVTFFNGTTLLGSVEVTATGTAGTAQLTLDSLPVGVADLRAVYSGYRWDGGTVRLAGSGSAPLPEAVITAATSTALTVDRVGATDLKLTASVAGRGAPGGTVVFYDGAVELGRASLVNGQAVFTAAGLAAGVHTGLRADYLGDAQSTASSSALTARLVKLPATTTTLSSSAGTSPQGTAITLTATVAGPGATPTGLVTFLHGSTVLGTATLSNGVATLSVSGLPTGAVGLTVTYAGDAGHASSVAALTQTVTQAPSTVTLLTSTPSAPQGAAVVLTARVASGASTRPGGTVVFMDGATVLGMVTLTNGVATLSWTPTATGARQLTATYQGDASSAVATSAQVIEQVTPRAATIGLTSSVTTVKQGVAFTLTATVTGASPTGLVTFFDGQTVVGTATVTNGVAQLATAKLYVTGTRTLRAVYSGDAANATVVSSTRSVSVTSGSYTAPTLPPTTTTALSLSAASTPSGAPVVLTATVAGGTTGYARTGTVSFFNGSTLIGSATVVNNQASLTLTGLAVGASSLKAVYSGDTRARTSASSTVTETVTKATSTITLFTPGAQVAAGAPVTLVAQVQGAAPGGTVTFKNGTTTVGTATVGATGLATLSLASLTAGTLTASYAGDANNAASTSPGVAIAVVTAPTATTTALNLSAATSPFGTAVTLTATVTGAPAGGTVSFFSGATLLGSAALSGGQAKLTVDDLPLGASSLRAVYSGGGAAASSASAVVTETVQAAASTTLLSSESGTGTLTLTALVVGAGGPTGEVVFWNGAVELGRATLSNGRAVLALTGLAAGIYDVRVSYAGDPSNAASASGARSEQVVAAPSDMELVLFTTSGGLHARARVPGVAEGGYVTFLQGATVLGTAVVVNEYAFLDYWGPAPLGDVKVTATYSGYADHPPATAEANGHLTVKSFTDTTLFVWPAGGTALQNSPVVLTARVNHGDASGVVSFYDGTRLLGSAMVRGGCAVLVVSSLPAGALSVTAAYQGDAGYAQSVSTAVQLSVSAAPASVSLAAAPAQVEQGGALTLTATVAGNAPEGYVAFVSGEVILGSAQLLAGVATLAIDRLNLPSGSAPIVAVFGGDPRNGSVASSEVVVNVLPGSLPIGTATGVQVIRSASDRAVTSIHGLDGQLLATIDAEGYLTELVYDRLGRVVETIGYATPVTGFENADAISAAVRAARAAGSLDGLRPGADASRDQHSFGYYDARGQRIATIDAEGYLTELGYDANGRLETTVRYARKALGTPSAASTPDELRPASDGEDQRTRRSYDALGRLTTLENAEGTVTRYAYDLTGNLVATTVASGTSEARSALARYDLQGRVTHELSGEAAALLVDGLTAEQQEQIWAAHATSHTYDAAGRRLSTTDALGHRTVYFYDDAGRLRFTVNAEGEASERRYDDRGRLVATVLHDRDLDAGLLPGLAGGLLSSGANATAAAALAGLASGEDSVSTFEYDARGLVEWTTDAVGGTTKASYDAFGGVVRTEQSIDRQAGRTVVGENSFDRRGLQVTATADAGDASHVNALSRVEYDAFGRVTGTWDANGNVRRSEYDRLGRVVQTIDPTNALRSATYDAFGRVLTQTNALGDTTTYRYDQDARRLTVITPEGISTSSEHDVHGQTVSVVDGNGHRTSYRYDRSGRLLETTSHHAGVATVIARNAYDELGRLEDSWDAEQLRTGQGKVHLTYDAANRLFTRTVQLATGALVTKYRYDEKGQQVAVTDANGVETAIGYDLAGRVLTQTVDPDGLALVTTYSYDDLGRTLTVESPGGTLTRHVYDDLGRRIETTIDPDGLCLKETFGYDANGNLLFRYGGNNEASYQYDAANRVVVSTDAGGVVTGYAHDAEGRVITATRGGASDRWSYDRDGRVSMQQVGGVCSSFTYDANGNVVDQITFANPVGGVESGGTFTFLTSPDATRDLHVRTVYDERNRAIITIDGVGAIVEQRYDGNGNVVERKAYAKALTAGGLLAGTPTLAELDQLMAAARTASPEDAATARAALELALQRAVAAVADPAHDAHIRREYDAAGRLTWSVDATGAVTGQTYDGNGNLVKQVAYATRIAETDLPHDVPVDGLNRVTLFYYDKANRRTFQVDALGGVTQYVYDDNGNAVLTIAHADGVAAPTSATDPLATSAPGVTRDDRVRPDPEVPWSDRVMRSVFDKANRLTFSIDALGGVTERRYDAYGNVTHLIAYANALSEAELAELADVVQPGAVSSRVRADVTRDRTTRSYYVSNNRLFLVSDPEGYWTRRTYDGLGNVSELYTWLSRPWTAGAPGDPSASEILLNLRWFPPELDRMVWDQWGRLARSAEGETYTYDGLGNKESYTNANNATWTYRYDAAGRLLEEISPQVEVTTSELVDGKVVAKPVATAAIRTTFTYDALGNVTSRTEGAGRPEARTTTYEYDALGRQVVTQFAPVDVYDADLDDLAANEASAPVLEAVSTSTRTTYDVFGDAVANVGVDGAVSYKAYDALGRVRYEVDAAGYVTGYVRNGFGEVTKLTRHAGTPTLRPVGSPPVSPDAPPSVTEIEQALAHDAGSRAQDRTVETLYDRMGRAWKVTQLEVWAFNGAGEGAELGQLYRLSPVTEYKYDAFGQLKQTRVLVDRTQASDPPYAATEVWATTTNYYDRRGFNVASIDAMGHATTRAYDAAGNVVKQIEYAQPFDEYWAERNNAGEYGTDLTFYATGDGIPHAILLSPTAADRREIRYAYDQQDRKISETLVAARVSTQPDGTTVVADLTRTFAYDAVGNQTRVTDALGGVTYTYYDALGRIRAVAEPPRPVDRSVGSPSLTPLTIFQRDAHGNVVVVSQRANGASQATATGYTAGADDAAHDRTTATFYDAQGRTVAATDAELYTRYMAYDRAGRLRKQWQAVALNTGGQTPDVRTSYVIFEYDALGRQTGTITPGSFARAEGYQGWAGWTGRIDLVSQAAAGVVKTQQAYNAFGELISRATYGCDLASGTPTEAVQTEFFDYDESGRVWRTNSGDGVVKVMLYDLAGHLTATISSDGSGGTDDHDLDLEEVTSASTFTLGAWQAGQSFRPADGLRSTLMRYDLLGRAIRFTLPERPTGPDDPQGQVPAVTRRPFINQTFDRWGNVTSRSDVRNAAWITSYGYNHLNQLTWESSPDGNGQQTASSPKTEYFYDALGRQVAVKDARGFVNGQVWDATGNLVEELHADRDEYGGVVQHTYDAFGNRVSTKDAEGNVTTYEYDKLGRNTAVISAEVDVGRVALGNDGVWLRGTMGGHQHLITRTVYDALGNRIRQVKTTGELQLGDERWTWVDGVAKEITEYTYDLRGNLVATKAPVGEYTYDLRGNPIAPEDPSGAVTRAAFDARGKQVAALDAIGNFSTWAYDAFGLLRKQRDLRDAETSFDYDSAGQLVLQKRTVGPPEEPAVELELSYQYDAAGQLTKISDQSLDPLSGGSINKITSYEYNSAGQHVRERTEQRGIVYQDQLLAYDTRGRLTLISATIDDVEVNFTMADYLPGGTPSPMQDVTIEYEYDDVGNRLKQVTTYTTLVPEVFFSMGYRYRYTATSRSETRFFAYDEMNRQTMVDGTSAVGEGGPTEANIAPLRDAGGKIVTEGGLLIEYDHNGNRVSEKSFGKLTGEMAWWKKISTFGAGPPPVTAGTVLGQQALTQSMVTPFDDMLWEWSVAPSTFVSPEGLTERSYRYDGLNRLQDVEATYLDWEGARQQASIDHRHYDFGSRLVEGTGAQGPRTALVDAIVANQPDLKGNTHRLSQYDAAGQQVRQSVYNTAGALDYTVENLGKELRQQQRTRLPGVPLPLFHEDGSPVFERIYIQVTEAEPGFSESEPWAGGPEGQPKYWVHDAEGNRFLTQAILDAEGRLTYDYGSGDVSGYDKAGNLTAYRTTPAGGTQSSFTIEYEKAGSYRQKTITGHLTNAAPGTTKATYDANGYLIKVDDTTAPGNDRTFVNDAGGVALLKMQYPATTDINLTEGPNRLRQLVVNGQVLGVYGIGKPDYAKPQGDFNLVYEGITPSTGTYASTSYQVRVGDSLSSIAQAVYGDSSLWYLIADANGLRGDQDLRPGMTVDVPGRVGGLHNDADTFAPYDPSRITGDLTPNLPVPRAKKRCGGIGLILAVVLVVVVAVAVTVLTAGVAATALAPAASATWTLGGVVSAGAGALSGTALAGSVAGTAMLAAGIGAAAGSAASQLVGWGIGLQDGFDWQQVAIAGIGGAVASGFAAGSPSWMGEWAKADSYVKQAASWVATGARASLSNALTQATSYAVGATEHWSWHDVIASGVGGAAGAAAGSFANGMLGIGPGQDPAWWQRITKGVVAGFAGGIAASAARGGRVVVQTIAADAFGNAFANSVVEVVEDGERMRQAAEERRKDLEATAVDEAFADAELSKQRATAKAEQQELAARNATQPSLAPQLERAEATERAQEQVAAGPELLARTTKAANPAKAAGAPKALKNVQPDWMLEPTLMLDASGLDELWQRQRNSEYVDRLMSLGDLSGSALTEPGARYYAQELPLGESGLGIGEGLLRQAMYGQQVALDRAESSILSPTILDKAGAYLDAARWSLHGLAASAIYTAERPGVWALQGLGWASEEIGHQTLDQLAALPPVELELGLKSAGLLGKFGLTVAAAGRQVALARAAALAEQAGPSLGRASQWLEANQIGAVGDVAAVRAYIAARAAAGDSRVLGMNLLDSMDVRGISSWPGYQAQHLIPIKLADHPILVRVNFEMDAASNGLFLRAQDEGVTALSRHMGGHPVYTAAVKGQLDLMDVAAPVQQLSQQVHGLQVRLRTLQMSGLPLYKNQGASVDLWTRWLNRTKG